MIPIGTNQTSKPHTEDLRNSLKSSLKDRLTPVTDKEV